MSLRCPFSSIDYLEGLSNIGDIDRHPDLLHAVLRRGIPGTNLFDGVGPWPYCWISGKHDIEVFCHGFRHLVTLSVVTHPGWEPSRAITAKADFRLLKQHYVYDPSKPTPTLSKRALRRLIEADYRGKFEVVTSRPEQLVVSDLYEQLKLRRCLTGGFFDLPRQHFASISRLPGAIFFRVSDEQGIGTMACGLIISDFLQILHFVTTSHGLSWNASYLMMHGLQEYVRHNGLRLLTGGMPMSGSAGLSIFKKRWANAYLPVYLLGVVNDHAAAATLGAGCDCSCAYFPAYRHAA